MKKIKLSTWAKQNDMRYLAAWKMAKNGLLPIETLPTGQIRVIVDDKPKIEDKVAIYCRVSNSQQIDTTLQLQCERLKNFCAAKGYKVSKIVMETSSGLNDFRKQWLDLLADTSITKIVVEHKDRFSRFEFDAFQKLLKAYGREIEVVNEVDDKQDLIDDFVSIITSYCSKIYGNKKSKVKAEKIIQELSSEK